MQFVRTKDVLRMLGVSRTTLWRMVQAGMFPQPVVSDITHNFEDLLARAQAPLEILEDRPSLMGGRYRTLLLRRST